MALEFKQQLKQTQQLLMSPQLQQAIKLLQMSRMELVEHIQQELLENPFLEEVQGSPELSDVDENFSELNESRASSEADEGYSFEEINKNGDWEDYLGELSSAPKTSSAHEYESIEDNNFIETRYAEKVLWTITSCGSSAFPLLPKKSWIFAKILSEIWTVMGICVPNFPK